MWLFSKKKTDAVPTLCANDITKEQIEAALIALEGRGAHFSRFYANLCGYLHEKIYQDQFGEEVSRDFLIITSSEPNFTATGREYAVNSLIKGIELVCNSEAFELRVFGVHSERNTENKEIIYKLKDAVANEGFKLLCSRLGFDVAEFLERVTVQRRTADLEKIVAKLEDRKDYLKPILLRALSRGRNKYGEIEYDEYINELREFLIHYFPEGSLPFFWHLPPLIFCASYVERNWLNERADSTAMPLEGIDFEHWCAKQIEQQGWAVRVSKCSGDQGIDIEAIDPMRKSC